jgi:glycolate oxidase iron-sulfur subunit
VRTAFSPEQLADPEVAASAGAIRRCVHCGFCTATCPTYVLTGDERDSPRGRIELIRDMLEKGGPPAASTVTHIDRCLSCLACATTCPSGVDYAQLIDHGRAHIEAHYERPWPQRSLRAALSWVLTHPGRLRWALRLGRLARPLEPVLRGLRLGPLAAMLRLVPPRVRPVAAPPPRTPRAARGRVILLQGCVEPVAAPQVRAAALRLLARCGYEVVLAEGEACCGAIPEHLGRADQAAALARTNLAAWARAGTVDAIVTTAAGCGTMLKAYGKLVGQTVPAKDILEFVGEVGLPPVVPSRRPSVAYHAACSLQHGQGIRTAPQRLLREAGYEVREVAEGHLCCGSAGVYNILQSEFATRLRDRKAGNIAATGAAVVAAGNVGCMVQLAPALTTPVLHPVELLDWATGGPCPAVLSGPQAPP